MGYTSEYINIDDDYEDLKNQFEIEKTDKTDKSDKIDTNQNQKLYQDIVKDISRNRIDNLKQIILEFQRIFNRIINGYVDPAVVDKTYDHDIKPERSGYEKDIPNYFAEKLNSLVDKYKKKLKNTKIKDDNNKHRVFKHWKGVTRGIYVEDFNDKYFNFDSDLVEAENISRYDSRSNMLLYYLIHEFSILLKYNKDGFIRTNVCNFLVEFIDRIFFKYNTDHLHVNNDIKRFMYVINSAGFLKETEEYVKTENTEGFYEEYVDMDEEPTEDDIERKIDEDEEQEALDLDLDYGDIEEGFQSAFEAQELVDLNYEEHEMSDYQF